MGTERWRGGKSLPPHLPPFGRFAQKEEGFQAGKRRSRRGITPTSPPWWCSSSHPLPSLCGPREVMWVLGPHGTDQQQPGMCPTVPCAPAHPRVGQGQLQQATVSVLWMLGHPTAKRHQRQFELGAMGSPWGLSCERRGQNANSDKLQLSSFTLSCFHKQSSLNMASMAPLGPRGLGSDAGWPWGTAPQAAVVCKRL